MEIILLSGGSGKRLWPLSNDARSKQFLKILEDENYQLKSMVQRVWRQLQHVNLAESSIIATNKTQVDIIQNQLGHTVELVLEPSRRDTFPAIALASTYLHTVKNIPLHQTVAVLPVDPFVQDCFFEKVKELETLLHQSNADIALIGVKPTYPSSKYGYIIPATNHTSDYIQVQSFKEKPSELEAEQLIQQDALWNCGVFAFKLGFVLSLLKERGLPIDYYDLLEQYDTTPKNSFDYEVVEQTENIVALPYDGYWKDLGTWRTLTEEMHHPQIGKGIVTEDCKGTHLINELDIPITVLGVPNVIVAASPDGILIADKDKSPRIKEIVGHFNHRPMYEERRWGWYKVLDHLKIDENFEVLTKRIGISAGKNLSYQYHLHRNEVWTIIKGEGIFVQSGRLQVVRPGDVLQIPIGNKHALKAVTDLEMIEVQTGSQLLEEDIVRVFMTWEEVEEHCYA
ncbi:sugar phosphate nucleotidyltransferase [Ureibacillus sinduriensis]|uniref:Mannose-1-phosphate guanylyltransferase n=1 Tax=Ureibacillus sinduriensis BLB-1 = JCM 15800 TaxID=1384057 RepID=A0A0A3HN45_9BACL|nr:sugar phosphate nucleotidyltransferase [Ureibacillus sinduriensis]KGR73991.1 mannose-1-phosphate guanylyltransferase [Ureibacillus sinduriensis BLB-1 = JCM 15800]